MAWLGARSPSYSDDSRVPEAVTQAESRTTRRSGTSSAAGTPSAVVPSSCGKALIAGRRSTSGAAGGTCGRRPGAGIRRAGCRWTPDVAAIPYVSGDPSGLGVATKPRCASRSPRAAVTASTSTSLRPLLSFDRRPAIGNPRYSVTGGRAGAAAAAGTATRRHASSAAASPRRAPPAAAADRSSNREGQGRGQRHEPQRSDHPRRKRRRLKHPDPARQPDGVPT